jgi:hypothetical protein
MSPADISDALVRFKVIPGRAVPAGEVAAKPAVESPPAPSLSAADIRGAVEPLVRDQAGDLRRFLGHEMASLEARLSADVARRIESAAADIVLRLTPPPPEPPPAPPRPWALIGALLAAVTVATLLAVTVLRYQGDLVGLRATIDRQAAALAAAPSGPAPASSGSWPGEKHPLGFGDAPFTASRQTQLTNWISALEQRGFVGTARVVVSLADYCLAGNPGEGYSIAPAEMPANSCDLRGSPADDLRTPAEREPLQVKTVLSGVTERTHGEIKGEVVYVKASGYPAAGANAGQWNAAAAKGHFVEFVAQPRTP